MKSIKSKTIYYFGILLAVFVALLFHSQFSFCQTDESFYSALLYRLFLGESLIVDEWHQVQFYSPILFPIYILYKAIIPSGDGVILFFRWIYIFISGFVAVVFFSYTYKTYNVLITTFASLLILLYSRANIQGCSYYNLFFQFIILGVIFYDCAKKKNLLFAFPAGIVISLAILCNPFFFPFVLATWIAIYIWRVSERKLLSRFMLGTFLVFGIYTIFILCRTTIPDILTNIHFLFHDPAHEFTLYSKLKQVSWQSNSLIPVPLYLLFIALTVYAFLSGKRGILLCRHFYIYCGCILLFMLKAVIKSPKSICFGITYSFTLIVFPLFVYRFVRKQFDYPMVLYSIGLFGSVAFFFASNTGLDAMTVGFTTSTIAGLLLLVSVEKNCDTISTSIKIKKFQRFTVMVSMIIVILFGCHRVLGIYRDAPLPTLTETLTIGPAAGLKTTPEHAEEYLSLYNTIRLIEGEYPEGQVIFGNTIPWMYLCCNWGYGSPSAWENTVSSERMKDYFELHPNKLPQIVFLVQPYIGGYETVPFNNHMANNTYNINPLEGWFWETYLCKAEVIFENHNASVYRLLNNGK